MNNLWRIISFIREIIPIMQFWGFVAVLAAIVFLIPAYFIFRPLVPLIALIMILYFGYQVFKDSCKYYEHELRTAAILKEQAANSLYQDAAPIETLPTAESIQDLILNDGEIPDEAFQRSDTLQ